MSQRPPNLPANVGGTPQLNFDALNKRLAATELGAPATALPASGTVGESLLFEAEAGVYWHLVYTGEATYPWAKIGGPPLRESNDAFAAEFTSTSYLYSGMPSIKIPLTMEAEVTHGGFLINRAAALNQIELQPVTGPTSLSGTGAGALGAAAYFADSANGNDGSQWTSNRLALLKGNFIFLGYKSFFGVASQVAVPRLIVDPVRVG